MTRWRRWFSLLLAVTISTPAGEATPVPFTLSLRGFARAALANGVLVTFQGVEDSTLPDCWRWALE